MAQIPDNTAARTALWRAMHVLTDAEPHIIDDTIGYQLLQPQDDWQQRPDMKYTQRLRASIVARSRFIDDTAKALISNGIKQYVLLGAGLDSFPQRYSHLVSNIHIYEIDQPQMLQWKQQRLSQFGYHPTVLHHFVEVNFETTSWWNQLIRSGFDTNQSTFLSCAGVTLYLTRAAIYSMLQQLTSLAHESTVAITFYLPLELLDEEDKPLMEMSIKGAEASGTPFVSFFTEKEITTLALEAGLKEVSIISTKDMTDRYFMNRADQLLPASGEFFLLAKTSNK
jgi:methyltransferase (TIGR00027 family)